MNIANGFKQINKCPREYIQHCWVDSIAFSEDLTLFLKEFLGNEPTAQKVEILK